MKTIHQKTHFGRLIIDMAILFLVLMFCLNAGSTLKTYGQAYASELASNATSNKPFKKATMIVIKTPFHSQDNYSNFGSYLVSKGFTIEKSSQEFLTLNTGMIGGLKNNSMYSLRVAFINSNIRIQVVWTYNASPYAHTRYRWQYSPAKSSTRYKIWEHLMANIEDFPGEIFYQ